jgi:exopolyphosphatase/guanosine-5'-triphosphate,3'-diphosphate pyrophosphatase
VIDVGSNSVLCLVAAPAGGGRLRVLADLLETTRLASGLREGGPLAPDARGRTLRAVAGFADRARALGAREVVGLGTAAMRAASDGPEFARAIAAETGVPVTILSGTDEARLAYRAVSAGAVGPLLAVDVGGRSTELVLGEGARIDEARSLPLGALMLTEELMGDRPADAGALAAVRERVGRVLAPEGVPARARPRQATLVASGGTATALAALDLGLTAYDAERVHGHVLDTDRLVAVALDGRGVLDPGRRRILPAGAVVLECVARAAGQARVHVSDHGIRHARLQEMLAGGVR